MRLANQLRLVLVIVATLACASGRARGPARPDRSVLTQETLRDQHYENAYQAIEALRANWLHPRGVDSFTSPSVVWVYMDNVKLGGVETLRTVPISAVSLIRHLDPNDASARYGIGHGAGVIFVQSWAAGTSPVVPVDSSISERVIENALVDSADGSARFAWFEYSGQDSIYRTLRPGANEYLNPVLAGFYPDPSAIRVGDDYYLVTSSFAYFPGVPIFHSKDLVSWTQIGHVLTRRSQLNIDSAGISRGIFAPVIRHNAGVFYMITTLIDRGGNFIVTATNPAGPWSDPIWLPSVDGIDPSMFFDDNGKAWVLNNGPPVERPRYDGHRAIWIQEFDVATKRMVGPRTMIVNGGVDLSKNPIWIEAPHIFKRNGAYYLICAEGGTGDQHSEVVFRSTAPTGPWIPYSGNPILTQRHLDKSRPSPITTTGHADFIETPNGEWWAVFLGTRTYDDDIYNTGRETFLMPVRWVNDWPVITTGTELVPYVGRRPSLRRQPAPAVPTSGNFTVRDDFDGPSLPMHWQTIRGAGTAWYDLTSSRGALTLRSRPATFARTMQPSFIGRRQQHMAFSASTSMSYTPLKNGDKAGVVAFQNDEFYYFLSVTRVDGATVVQLEKHAGAATGSTGTVVASAPVSTAGPIQLRIVGRSDRYDFSYATRPGEWTLLHGNADGRILSTKVAGGFVGTMLGLYAFSAP